MQEKHAPLACKKSKLPSHKHKHVYIGSSMLPPSSHFLKMSLRAQSLALVTLLLVLLLIKIEGNSTPKEVLEKGTNDSSPSTWLTEKDENQIIGCAGRPLICSRGEFPPRFICCGDRCVDVTSDRENCGLCGVRCTFNRQCCNRLCLNTNLNIFNCGRCGRVCPVGRLCVFGLCAYEQALPVSPPPPPPSPSPSQPLPPLPPVSPSLPLPPSAPVSPSRPLPPSAPVSPSLPLPPSAPVSPSPLFPPVPPEQTQSPQPQPQPLHQYPEEPPAMD